MFGGIPRLLYIGVDQWRAVLLIGISLFVIGSGVAVGAGVPMQDERDSSSGGTITVEQRHHARAVESASVYRPDEVLRGKSLYLLSDAPTVTVQQMVQTRDGPPTIVDAETRVVYQVQYAGSDVHRERGISASESGEITDGNVTVGLELDMVRVRDRLQGLREKFGGETSVQAVLLTRVEFSSQSSGSIVSRTPVTFTTKGYHIPARTERKQYGVFEAVREPVPERTVSVGSFVVGHTQLFGLALALVGFVVAGVSLGYLRRVTEADKAALHREAMHRRFSELIARVESGECPPIDRKMESLQDLVFVGDDANAPVLYFPAEDRYVVRDDGIVYGYQFDQSSFVFGDNPN
jgi:hypothetical protein